MMAVYIFSIQWFTSKFVARLIDCFYLISLIFLKFFRSDLMRNPMIVPLKVLKGHGVIGDVGVTSILFHPRQPWIFSAGADGIINLYQDI